MKNLFFRLFLVFAVVFSPLLNVPVHAQNTRIMQTPGSVAFSFQKGDQTGQQYITVTINDLNGNPMPLQPFDFYFSDQREGLGITATASSGTAGLMTSAVTGQTPNASLSYITAATPTVASSRISMHIVSDNNGQAEIGVIDSGHTLFYPVVQTDGASPLIAVGAQMTAANYK